MPSEKGKLLKIIVLVTISKDIKSLLPDEMVDYYESQGVEFNFIPLDLKGKAKSISHLCPNLESNKPEDMGAYYPFHQKKNAREVKSNLILIDNDYYLYDYDYSVEFKQRWHKVAQLGHLAEKIKRSEHLGDGQHRNKMDRGGRRKDVFPAKGTQPNISKAPRLRCESYIIATQASRGSSPSERANGVSGDVARLKAEQS